MNNTTLLRNIFRAIILLVIQVFILKRISLGGDNFNYISIFIYPIFLMYLPISTPVWGMVLLGAVYGYSIDIFYDTIGMNMAASIFSAFVRSWLIKVLEPQGGYKLGISPTRRQLGFQWFIYFAAVFMFIHIFIFYSVEEFTPFYWKKIEFNTIPSYVVSLLLVAVHSLVFDPSN